MGSFVIKTTAKGSHFILKAGNGQVIATSQNYKGIESCRKGIESVRKNALVAAIEDQTVDGFATQKNPKFEIYLDKAGEFRFRLTATNGEAIAASEGYAQKASCNNGIESVRKNAPDAKVEEIEG